MAYEPKWLTEAMALRVGTTVLDPPRQALCDWVQETYGEEPISVFLHITSSGIVGTVSIIFWDKTEHRGFRDGSPKYDNDATAILGKAEALGMFADITGLSNGISVRHKFIRPYMADQIVKGLPKQEFENVIKTIGIPSITWIMVAVGAFRIFFDDDDIMLAYDNLEFKAKCRNLLWKVVQDNDPNGYVLDVPNVYLESQTELEQQYQGNLYHFFK